MADLFQTVQHFGTHHPFQLAAIASSTVIVAWILWGYSSRKVSWRYIHKRPINYIALITLAAEILHAWKGC